MSNTPFAVNRPAASETVGYRDALLGIVSVLLGLLVAVLGFFALMMWLDARHARDRASTAATSTSGASMAGMDMSGSANLGSLTSYAGAAPANADALATAH